MKFRILKGPTVEFPCWGGWILVNPAGRVVGQEVNFGALIAWCNSYGLPGAEATNATT
jgi:hypothetical protein